MSVLVNRINFLGNNNEMPWNKSLFKKFREQETEKLLAWEQEDIYTSEMSQKGFCLKGKCPSRKSSSEIGSNEVQETLGVWLWVLIFWGIGKEEFLCIIFSTTQGFFPETVF